MEKLPMNAHRQKMIVNENIPTDRGWAWIVLMGSFLQSFILVGLRQSMGLYFVEYMEKYDAPASTITFAISITRLTSCIGSMLILNVGVQFLSNRTFIMMGGIFGLTAYLLNAFAPTATFLMFSQGFCFGLTVCCSQGTTLVMVQRYFQKRRGLATLIANVGGSGGSLCIPQLVRYLIQEHGLQYALIITAGLLLNISVVGSLMRPIKFYVRGKHRAAAGERVGRNPNANERLINKKQENDKDYVNTTEKDNPVRNIKFNPRTNEVILPESRSLILGGSEDVKSKQILDKQNPHQQISQQGRENASKMTDASCSRICAKGLRQTYEKIFNGNILRNRLFQMFIAVAFLASLGNEAITFIPPHAKDLGVSKRLAAMLITILGITGLVSKTVLALVIDRQMFQRYKIVAWSLILGGISMNLVPLYKNFYTMMLLSIGTGMFGGVYIGLFSALLVDFVGLPNLSGAVGFIMLLHGGLASITSPISGYIHDATGSFTPSFHITGITSVLGGILLLNEPFFRRMEEKRVKSLQQQGEEKS